MSPADLPHEDADLVEPGWYYKAVNADPAWVNNAPNGPYDSYDDAYEDAVITAHYADGGQ